MKYLILISLLFISLFAKSQTYVPEGRGITFASLEGCKKKIGGLPCDSCFVMTGVNGKISRCLHISEIRAMFDSLYLTGNCPCCTEILYFDSDTAAYYQGRVNKDEYYLTAASHLEGFGKGFYKQVPENYGWELHVMDSVFYGFNSLVVKSKNTVRVGFDAAFLSSCRVEPPAVDLNYYASDSLAIAAGYVLTESYQLSMGNLYGFPKNFLKKIVEP